MAHMSNYLENELLDHALGTGAWTGPTNVYALLHTASPGDDGTTAVAGNTAKSGAITFGAASGGVATSTSAASWTNVNTSETYVGISLWDNNTAGAGTGNCLFAGDLASSVAVTTGDDFEVAIGDLTITFT